MPLLYEAMVSKSEPTHMCRGLPRRHRPGYSNWEGRRRGGSLLPYVTQITSPQLANGTAERDSPRDQLVVSLFLLTVFGLLLGAGIKGRMVKAGLDTSLPWNTGRKWWQVGALFCNIVSQSGCHIVILASGIGTETIRRY